MSRVYLIGAGPGDPELLTRKAFRLLQSAGVVLHDSLVSSEILALIPDSAERVDVGKRRGVRLLSQDDINALLVSYSRTHDSVVRLKGGDPMLFGRAAEEIQALREASVSFEVVPGISAAFAAAAASGVSLTDRRAASSVLFTTFSRAPEAPLLPAVALSAETTLIVYMPGPDYSGVSRWLLDSGIVAETPCLVISKASRRDQLVHPAPLSQLSPLPPLPAPALLLVGRVAAQCTGASSALDLLSGLSLPDQLGSFIS